MNNRPSIGNKTLGGMRLGCTALLSAIVLISGIPQDASAVTKINWTGASSTTPLELTDSTNWDSGTVPTGSVQATFLGDLGTQVTNLTVSNNMSLQYIFFGDYTGANAALPYADGGPGRTFTGTGTINITANGNIDSGNASSPVMFSNTELDMNRAAQLYSTNSNLVINTSVFKVGLGSGGGTPLFNSQSGVDASNNPFSSNIIINPSVDFSSNSVTRGLALRPNPGTTIALNGGLTPTTRLSSITVGTNNSTLQGTVTLGSSSTWAGNTVVLDSNLLIKNNDSLGSAGSQASGYTQVGGGNAYKGALQVGTGVTTGEYIYLDQRGTVTTELTNVQNGGTTTANGNIELENGGNTGAGIMNWAIAATGTAVGDQLVVSAPIYTTDLENTNVNGTGLLTFQGAGTGTMSGNISERVYTKGSTLNVLNVAKSDGGTWTFSGANTYSGTTAVNGGTLVVNGSHNGGGAYSVNSGGTLAGSGTINTAGNAGVTVAAGGLLAPGGISNVLHMNLGTGSLDVSGAVAATNSQSMLFTLDTPATSSMLQLTSSSSTLTIGTGALEFDDFKFTTTGSFGPGTYVLFDTGAAIIGSLGSNLTGILGGFAATVSLADGGHDVVLTVVPEPSAFALGVLSLIAVVIGRRTRCKA